MSPPTRHPPIYVRVLLTLRQCEAVQRAIGLAVRAPEAEADHDQLVQALGSITETADRVREGKATKEETV